MPKFVNLNRKRYFVFGDESGSGAVSYHEAGIEAAFSNQKSGQLAQRRVNETLDATFAHGSQLVDTYYITFHNIYGY